MQEVNIFYDRYGAPKLRLLRNDRLVSFSGKSIGFVNGPYLYNYRGQHVGWLEGDIMRDVNGNTVAFGKNPTDTPRPFLPFKQFRPFPAFVEFEPFRPYKQAPRFKPYKRFGWSPVNPITLFLGDTDG